METAYDGQGNPYLITSYDATTSGSVVNQIQRAYNGLGQMTQEWQATSGAVNTGTTPSVQYGYSFAPSGTTNHSRLTSITYPNGRVLTYNYATGLADNISRLSSITDGATTLESYDYLGLGTVVRRAHAQTGVDQTYVKLTGESDGAAGDKYIGLDAFGRVVDQRWTTSGGTTSDRFGYAYDRDSNRVYKENLVSSSNSELYSYDNLNQLSSFQRGTLNGTKNGLTGSASRSQSWDFDALGNFDSQTTDGTTQTRTANRQNEITSISGATTPTYDSNGNLTKDETGRTFSYDAWNRLATVKDSGGTLLATYKWNGLGHRVRELRGSTTTDLYYSDQWQVLEERVGGVAKFSYVWSPVYVDAMIARDRDTDANGTLDERLYAVNDANFNVTALINTTGTVVERYQYDPFGKFGVLDGSWATRGSSSYGWNYLHQGGRWDADSGVYSFRNREISPTLGRWMQIDPIGFSGSDLDLYGFVGENPVNATDSSGLLKVKTLPGTFKLSQKPGETSSLDWDFTLDKGAAQDGYFVQKVTVRYFESKNFCPPEDHIEAASNPAVATTYWEAFPVEEGKTMIYERLPNAVIKTKFTDRQTFVAKKDTSGVFIAEGEVRFVAATDKWDPVNDPKKTDGWVKGAKYRVATGLVIGAGEAFSTKDQPSFWDNGYVVAEGTGYRMFGVAWSFVGSSSSVIGNYKPM